MRLSSLLRKKNLESIILLLLSLNQLPSSFNKHPVRDGTVVYLTLQVPLIKFYDSRYLNFPSNRSTSYGGNYEINVYKGVEYLYLTDKSGSNRKF